MGMVANHEEVALAKLSRFASVSLTIVQWGSKTGKVLFSNGHSVSGRHVVQFSDAI